MQKQCLRNELTKSKERMTLENNKVARKRKNKIDKDINEQFAEIIINLNNSASNKINNTHDKDLNISKIDGDKQYTRNKLKSAESAEKCYKRTIIERYKHKRNSSINSENRWRRSVNEESDRADDASMRSNTWRGADVTQNAQATLRSDKRIETDVKNERTKKVNSNNTDEEHGGQISIIDSINRDRKTVKLSEINSEIQERDSDRLSMDRGMYEQECERRKMLMNQERALRQKYKARIQQMAEVVEENERIESRCRTLRRMIEEIPMMEKPKEDAEEKSLMEEIKEIESMMKPAVIFTDRIEVRTPNEQYGIKTEVVVTVEKPIKREVQQPIRPFGITYNFHENMINRQVYSTWGQQLEVVPIKARVDASFKIVETQKEKTMTIGKLMDNNIQVQTDETGHVIDRIFASDIESIDDTQSIGTMEVTDNENISEDRQKITVENKVNKKDKVQSATKKVPKI